MAENNIQTVKVDQPADKPIPIKYAEVEGKPCVYIRGKLIKGVEGLKLGDNVVCTINGMTRMVSVDDKGEYSADIEIASGSIKKLSGDPKKLSDTDLDEKIKGMKDEG